MELVTKHYKIEIDGKEFTFYAKKISVAYLRHMCKIPFESEVWAYAQDSNMAMTRLFNEDIVDIENITKFRVLDNEP